MAETDKLRVAFISSFPPRKCGIGTFTSDLIRSIFAVAKAAFQPLVVAMRANSEARYQDPVRFEIRQNVKNDYICAADYLNFSHVDLVCVQHEYGLFGGDAGSYLDILLSRLKPPIVTTLHTILDDPDKAQHKVLVDLCNCSQKVITMNERGITMLRDIYGIAAEKIELIPHGIPDVSFVDSNYYKHKFGMEGRRTILTFGLLNTNKGVEIVLDAMPAIIEAEPTALYIVLGMTHPNVLKEEGESYRFRLQQMVKDLGLEKHVIFHNRFVDDEELRNFLCAADVYVTPYLSRSQLTSGTLSFAVGTGKAVVSTPYWAAVELLADGRGILVPFSDSKRTAQAIISILKDDNLYYSLRRQAYEYGRTRTWPLIGQHYWRLFNTRPAAVHAEPKTMPAGAKAMSSIELPEPSLDHVRRLTDETGICQHARFTIPDRANGYCTDDNARAVMVTAKYYAQYREPQALELLDRYLAFIMHAQKPDGLFRNFMNFERTWWQTEPASDAFGRALWAFGTVIAQPPSPQYLSVVKDCFDSSVQHVPEQHPRAMAYSILGMSDYLKQFPGASDIKRYLELAADGLVIQYGKHSLADWQWFEDILTYDNSVLPHALFVAGAVLDNAQCIEVAQRSCRFLLANTLRDDHFSFIGCNGWYRHGKARASFDQQPVEAASTVMMLAAAYEATKDKEFLDLQRKAFDWFLGANDLRVPLYDFRTKGCSDGLMPTGANINQGAESTLGFLLALLTMIESYSLIDKANNGNPGDVSSSNAAKATSGVPVPIKSISGNDRSTSGIKDSLNRVTGGDA
jgi:glycosyltransferase involved in cell wall biosynthesis